MFKVSRFTSSGKFYPEIDGLRFFAIMPVILAHSLAVFDHNVSQLGDLMDGPFSWVFSAGDLGVQVFFVISGYILGLGFHRAASEGKKPILKHYYLRRLARLEPPYILVMTLFFLISLLVGRFGFFEGLGNYLASVFYVHNVLYEKGSLINTVAWTLEIELQFYVLAPLLFYIYNMEEKKAVTAFLIILAGFLLSSYLMGGYKWTILTHGHFFVLGAFLHILSTLRGAILFRRDKFNIIFFAFLLFSFYQLDFFYDSILGNFIKLACLLVLFSLALGSVAVKRILSIRFLYLTGGMCYSIYLIHYPLLSFFSKVWSRITEDQFFIFLPLSIILVLMVSMAFFVFVERPFMYPDIFKSFFRRLRPKIYHECESSSRR